MKLTKNWTQHKELIETLIITHEDLSEEKIGHLWTTFTDHLATYIDQFQELAFPQGFGFDAFTIEDVLNYLTDPKQFSLSLKKTKGKGILYGRSHTKCRQNLINSIPKEIRLPAILKKLDYFDLKSKLSNFSGQEVFILDIQDIGAANSIYKISIKTDEKITDVVLKEEHQSHLGFICQLYRELGLPTFQTVHIEDSKGAWQLSEYLGDVTLWDYLQTHSGDTRDIERQCAIQAAIGDVLGRGDRHFENYLVKDNLIYPIDIAYLFWQDNEEWLSKYTAGGMIEINIIASTLPDKSKYEAKLETFLNDYQHMITILKNKQEALIQIINTHYWHKSPYTKQRVAFVKERLENSEQYLASQKKRYTEGLQLMSERRKLKENLQQSIAKDPSLLENPWIKMYALSDKDRPTCFFLLEEKPQDIQDLFSQFA